MLTLTNKHITGIEWASLALSIMAGDNGMSRTTARPDIDETMATQAIRVGDDMEEFVTGEDTAVQRMVISKSVRDFHEWLIRCFDGDLSSKYFK